MKTNYGKIYLSLVVIHYTLMDQSLQQAYHLQTIFFCKSTDVTRQYLGNGFYIQIRLYTIQTSVAML
jgi:hypothetical protein